MTPQELELLITAQKSLVSSHANLLNRFSKWTINGFISPPEATKQGPFEQDSQVRAQTADQQTIKGIEKLKSDILKLISQQKYDLIFPILEELRDLLRKDEELLAGPYHSNFLSKNPKAISTLEEFEKFLHSLYNDEHLFRLNISSHYTLTMALLECMQALEPLPNSITNNNAQTAFIEELQRKLPKSQMQLQMALTQYDEVKLILKKHLDSTKQALEQAQLNLEKASDESSAQDVSSITQQTGVLAQPNLDASDESAAQAAASTAKQILFQQAQSRFDTSLLTLQTKVAELQEKAKNNKNYRQASKKAMTLYVTLLIANNDFFVSKTIDLSTFKQQCEDAIRPARLELAKHRGWSEVLLNIAFVLLSITSLGLANLGSKLVNNRYRFLSVGKTDSEQKLDGFSSTLNEQLTLISP